MVLVVLKFLGAIIWEKIHWKSKTVLVLLWNNDLVVKALDFEFMGSRVQNHWVASRSTQRFILPRSISLIPGPSGNWMVKSKLSPRCGSATLRQFNPIDKMGLKSFSSSFWFHMKSKVSPAGYRWKRCYSNSSVSTATTKGKMLSFFEFLWSSQEILGFSNFLLCL